MKKQWQPPIDMTPELDLHKFIRDPDKARKILDLCIADNISKGNTLIRVIHGKGKGDFRKMIHSHLDKHPEVDGYTECDPGHGGSGATWVHLKGTSRQAEDDTKS